MPPLYESCTTCLNYLERRQRGLIPALGRTLQRTGETSKQLVDRYFRGIHRRHLSGRSLDPIDDGSPTRPEQLLRDIFTKENSHG